MSQAQFSCYDVVKISSPEFTAENGESLTGIVGGYQLMADDSWSYRVLILQNECLADIPQIFLQGTGEAVPPTTYRKLRDELLEKRKESSHQSKTNHATFVEPDKHKERLAALQVYTIPKYTTPTPVWSGNYNPQTYNNAWSGGVMVFLVVLALLIPLIGLIICAVNLSDQDKKEQAQMLIGIGMIGTFLGGMALLTL